MIKCKKNKIKVKGSPEEIMSELMALTDELCTKIGEDLGIPREELLEAVRMGIVAVWEAEAE